MNSWVFGFIVAYAVFFAAGLVFFAGLEKGYDE